MPAGFFIAIEIRIMKTKKDNSLSWDDFMKVEMRVGTVLRAELNEKARHPAYKIYIDFGELGTLKSSAQITKKYQAEELAGRQVIAVVNFPPKQIADMMSECLILGAVEQKGEVTLIRPDIPVENGMRIL
jgi:tRNA-binding protein